MATGIAKEIDIVRDVNLKIISPLKLSVETTDGMRELSSESIFASITNDSISNTTVETAFAPDIVGSKTIAAGSLKVGDVLYVTASGILSTL